MIEGIDISAWQGDVDFAQVAKAGYRFAYIKATEGLTYTSNPASFSELALSRTGGGAMGAATASIAIYRGPDAVVAAADYYFDDIRARA